MSTSFFRMADPKVIKYPKLFIWAFIILSLVLSYIAGHFAFDQYLDHVQEWNLKDFRWTRYFFEENSKWVWAYFIVDAVWVIFFILLAKRFFDLMLNTFDQEHEIKNWQKKLAKWFPRILVMAILLDWAEAPLNIGCLFYGWNWLDVLSTVYILKVAAFALIFLILLIQVAFFIILQNYWKQCRSFLKHNILSIPVIVLIVFVIVKTEQGGALIDRVIDEPGNLLAMFIFINILVLMTWHYPYYHNLFSEGDNKNNHNFRFIGVKKLWQLKFNPDKVAEEIKDKKYSFVNFKSLKQVYTNITFNADPVRDKEEYWYHLQRMQASIIYVLVVFVFSNHLVKSSFIGLGSLFFLLPLIALGGGIWLYMWFFYRYQNGTWWEPFKRLINWMTYVLFILIFLQVYLYFFSTISHGNLQIIKLVTFCLTIMAMLTFYLPISIVRTQVPEQLNNSDKKTWMIKLICRWFCYDYNFLFILSSFWWVAVILFSGYTLLSNYSENQINSINVILTWVIFAFGFANIITKLANTVRLLKTRKDAKNPLLFYKYKKRLGIVLLSLGVLFVITQGTDNRFHHLKLVKKESSGIPLDTYLNAAGGAGISIDSANLEEPYYVFITGDGGGLRAAYWNLLVMQQLDFNTGNQIYSRTLATTGVSGGMIGQGVYFALKNKKDGSIQATDMEEFGISNPLSTDLTFLLGKRLATNFLPFPRFTQYLDDSSEKMAKSYMKKVCKIANKPYPLSTDETEVGLRQYWEKAYIKSQNNCPLLIVNSAQSERSIKGIAAPFDVPLNTSNPVFKSAVSILDFPHHPNKTLSYTDALFTTNRFPLISPAASIQDKGHFLDAGYIDNSGLSTLIDFIDFLKTNEKTKLIYENKIKGKIILLNIQDGKQEYVYNNFWHLKDSLHHIAPSSEVEAILSGASNLSLFAMPVYWDQKARQLEKNGDLKKYFRVSIPYLINRVDVQQLFSGQLKTREVEKKIEELNEKCLIAIESYNRQAKEKERISPNYVVSPPLSRVLSPRVTNYMKAMCNHHPDIRAIMEEFKK